ncbi:dTDP-4-dehydrorhamnose reductase [Prosthecomicrobium pneumaticum]|uniref:dTDP-4-dehydrorhamnose reductase n=1 Tax=Prosthecomicrobium pneumaticum TaxID=81895 RepID=A0A7W9CV13_9HYPH|nr:dTDP-4-dehydrorhamnose reductase [Prosthecomicrobium pneumaticum]MBB5752405.1 dTDP-4-dehydrorhamnose reductase [Prosthecomicrobium pneumaticum]
MTRPVLVAGRTGQVARALQRAAVARGVPLVALGRPDLDVTDAASIAAALAAHRPSLLVNAAAWTAVDRAETEEAAAFAVNAEGPRLLARAAAAAGIGFIHLSSDYVYDGGGNNPRDESNPVAPLSAYGRSKAAGDAAALDAYAEGTVILRTSWVHDPEGQNFIRTMLRLSQERAVIRVVADQHGAPTAASSLAAAILAIAAAIEAEGLAGRAGVFHAADAGCTNWAEIARTALAEGRAFGLKAARIEEISTADYPTPAPRPLNSRLDCRRLAETWGIVLPDWRQGVAATIHGIMKKSEEGQG